MVNYYPMMLNITDQPVVVIGGGSVATRKVVSLLSAQAQVTVISPDLSPKLQQLVDERSIKWKNKTFTPEDLEGAFLIIAATNSSSINEMIAKNAKPHQLCNIVDNEEQSQFIVPSVVKRGPLTIAISTSGANPKLSKKIKKQIEEQYDESYEAYILFLQKARRQIIEEITDKSQKSELLNALLDPQFLTLTKTNNLAARDALFKQLLQRGSIL